MTNENDLKQEIIQFLKKVKQLNTNTTSLTQELKYNNGVNIDIMLDFDLDESTADSSVALESKNALLTDTFITNFANETIELLDIIKNWDYASILRTLCKNSLCVHMNKSTEESEDATTRH